MSKQNQKLNTKAKSSNSNSTKANFVGVSSGVNVKKALIIGVSTVLVVLIIFFVLLGAGVFGRGNKITGDTSPDSARQRVEQILPRAEFEKLFPFRFGSQGWKERPETAAYYSQQQIANMKEYYSYDNLLSAVEWLAGHIYILEWRQNDNGSLVSYAPRQSALNKATGKVVVLNTEPDFNGEWNLNKPIVKLEIDYGTFLLSGNQNAHRREMAAFLANASHETGEQFWDQEDKFNGGLYWNEEISCINGGSDAYTDHGSTSFPPVDGQYYHGRGPFQLSWNTNYGLFSGIVFDDKSVLLKAPGMVVRDGRLGFMSALWFWMTPQYPKGSMHEVITDTWVPLRKGDEKIYTPGFGLTIVIINGGFEAGYTEDENPKVKRRIDFYRRFCEYTGANISGEKLDTKGMPPWT